MCRFLKKVAKILMFGWESQPGSFTYSIYSFDFKPNGFSCMGNNGYITNVAVENTGTLVEDTRLREDMVEINYALGKKFYSHKVLYITLINLKV